MKKLLIIDNSSLIINVFKDMFSKHNNFKIYMAKSYEEAINLIKEHKFFCSISNLVLPDALNAEILELLDKNSIPTVVLTSSIDESSIKIIKSINIVDYVLKDSISQLHAVYKLVELLLFIEDKEVLVVEDSKLSAALIKKTLESLLLKVHIAQSGALALDILEKNNNISLVITDYNMSPMNGLELIRELRKIDAYNHLPVISISSENSDDLKIKLFKNGTTDFLLKPILQEELKTKIVNIFTSLKDLEEIKEFDTIFDNNVISSSTDAKGIIKSVSEAFCKISGYKKEELIGKAHNMVRHPDMESSVFKNLWETVNKGNTWEGEVKNLKKDGSFYWVNAIIKPKFDNKGNIRSFTSVREDITDKKRIYELAITDGLTTLYNRRYFNEIAPKIVETTLRNNDIFAFVLLDIDNFKKYNDTYGHQEGDNVLINVSKALNNTFKRSNDLVFRLGGEEFGILICAKSKEDIVNLCEEARKSIESLEIEHLKNIPYNILTASFGTMILDSNNKNIKLDTIYKKADDTLYIAKESGRNKVEYC